MTPKIVITSSWLLFRLVAVATIRITYLTTHVRCAPTRRPTVSASRSLDRKVDGILLVVTLATSLPSWIFSRHLEIVEILSYKEVRRGANVQE